MAINYSVSLGKIIKEFSLEILSLPTDPEKIMITTAEINRPGLHMAGYFEFFDKKRIQMSARMKISLAFSKENQLPLRHRKNNGNNERQAFRIA